MTSVQCPIFSRSSASGQSNAWRGTIEADVTVHAALRSLDDHYRTRGSGADTGGRFTLSPAQMRMSPWIPAANVDPTAIHQFWAVHTDPRPDPVRKLRGLGDNLHHLSASWSPRKVLIGQTI